MTHHRSVGPEHGHVDASLLHSELAVGREGARDVRHVAVVLAAHVEQTEKSGRVKLFGQFPFDNIKQGVTHYHELSRRVISETKH